MNLICMIKEACPNCGSTNFVEEKMIMLGKFSAGQLYAIENYEGCRLHKGESLSIDKLDPKFVKEENMDRFVDGLYCSKCGVGFIPEYMLKK